MRKPFTPQLPVRRSPSYFVAPMLPVPSEIAISGARRLRAVVELAVATNNPGMLAALPLA